MGSKASVDKGLSQISAWMSHVAFGGLIAIAALPPPTVVPQRPVGRVTTPTATAEVPKAAPVKERAAAQPSLTPKDRAIVPPADAVRVAPPAVAAVAPAAAPTATPTPPAVGAAPPAPPPDVWTPDELVAGLRQCVQLLASAGLEVEMEEPMKHGQCGTPAPLALRSAGRTQKVAFDPAPTMNCRLAASLGEWVDKVLQPAAQEVLGSRVVRIVGSGSYSCRNIYNNPKLQLSEHATGNAIDIGGFVTADGRTILVAKTWGPTERDIVAAKKKAEEQKKVADKDAPAKAKPNDQAAAPTPSIAEAGKKADAKKGRVEKTDFKADPNKATGAGAAGGIPVPSGTKEALFLKRVHAGSCTVFETVLGPEANEAHRDHFHLDMKGRRSSHAVCH